MFPNRTNSALTRPDQRSTDWARHAFLACGLVLSGLLFLYGAPNSPLRAGATPHSTSGGSTPSPLWGEGRGEGLPATVHGSASSPDAFGDLITLGGETYRMVRKNIEDVTASDLVLASDPETGELAAKEVAQTFRRVTDHLRILEITNSDGSRQTIETTDEHPFWVPARGWVNASELATGDTLSQSDGHLGTVASTRRDEHPEGIPVYNFEVADLHCYFVSQSARTPPVLVHNANCGVELGNKLKFLFGEATGSAHNVERSQALLRQLESVGLPDNPANREYLAEHLAGAFANPNNVARIETGGRIAKESLLMGPLGGLKVESIWDGTKLITVFLFGG